MAVWHAGNTLSNIISGFLAAGILEHMDAIAGLHAWQWFFLIEGIASIVVAVTAFFVLPSWPSTTKFLTEQQREMAQYRVLVSNGGKEEVVGGTWDGVKDAVRDPFTWLFCAMHFSLVTAQSFKDFFPSVSIPSQPFAPSILTPPLDRQDLRLRHHHDLPRTGTTLRNRLHQRLRHRLLIRPLPRILLPHRHPHRPLSCGLLHSHLHTQRRCTLLRHHPPYLWYLQRPEPAIELGNNACAGTAQQEGGADCDWELYQSDESLVHSLFLPDEPGAVL